MKHPDTSRGAGPHDVIALGAGSAGLVTAAVAGDRTMPFERTRMGDVCLDSAFVPSKALIRSARIASVLRQADRSSFGAGKPEIDCARFIRRMRSHRVKIEPPRSQATGLVS